ncbi:unnamed protein product [Discosporangium mesarthrocarpum]
MRLAMGSHVIAMGAATLFGSVDAFVPITYVASSKVGLQSSMFGVRMAATDLPGSKDIGTSTAKGAKDVGALVREFIWSASDAILDVVEDRPSVPCKVFCRASRRNDRFSLVLSTSPADPLVKELGARGSSPDRSIFPCPLFCLHCACSPLNKDVKPSSVALLNCVFLGTKTILPPINNK